MIRCLIVDDSRVFQELLRRVLLESPDVAVVGTASSGREAVAQARRLQPDVITMDVNLPGLDGLSAIREIMATAPTRIIVISGKANEIAFQALQLGAVEVFPKPLAANPHTSLVHLNAIRLAVRTAPMATLAVPALVDPQFSAAANRLGRALTLSLPRYRPSCIGMAASTGGPSALQKILSRLPTDFPIPILVVQHIAEAFVGGFVRWLGGHCKLQVKIAEDGETLAPGKVLFANGRHLLAARGQVRLDDAGPVRGAKPSGTILFTSLAVEFGNSAVGFILTGMGDDGCAGLKLLRERGGLTIAQAEAGCAIYGMPRVALETGAAELALPLDEIPLALRQLADIKGATSW